MSLFTSLLDNTSIDTQACCLYNDRQKNMCTCFRSNAPLTLGRDARLSPTGMEATGMYAVGLATAVGGATGMTTVRKGDVMLLSAEEGGEMSDDKVATGRCTNI